MVTIEHVKKNYGKASILKDVSLHVKKGRILCLLGPNGSGKSTLINCILSLVKYGGIIRYNNFTKKDIGLILEDEGFCKDMNIYNNLRIDSMVKKGLISKDELQQLIAKVELAGQEKKLVNKLSMGMRKRLSIASALINDPDILIWDEPYNSLDPEGIIFLRELIISLNKKGKTLIISTHLLAEVEKIADDIALIYNGEILSVMEMNKIIEQFENLENFYLHHIKNSKKV
ncbi:MAG: ABC transporter ATP-binding protein [Bacteroidales bacterium]|jgi:ABC-type multidrug transport system ATPase subunit|nr:ABC transporter ATP-binding protein [Bacteroidales bacterium]MDY0196678.1 ABC transporter ATP-binding protein [Tenuifilaceae bacterium]